MLPETAKKKYVQILSAKRKNKVGLNYDVICANPLYKSPNCKSGHFLTSSSQCQCIVRIGKDILIHPLAASENILRQKIQTISIHR